MFTKNHTRRMTFSLTFSLTHSLTHSFTHSFTHPFTHSFTHSLTHRFTLMTICAKARRARRKQQQLRALRQWLRLPERLESHKKSQERAENGAFLDYSPVACRPQSLPEGSGIEAGIKEVERRDFPGLRLAEQPQSGLARADQERPALLVGDVGRGIDAQEVVDGGGDLGGADRIGGRVGRPAVGRAVDLAAADPGAGQDDGIAERP